MIFRKQKGEKRAEPMPKKHFRRICKALRAHGVLVWLGDTADKICRSQHAEAFTLNEKTVVFCKDPSRSVVFEELIHLWQFANHRCDGTIGSRIRCEIEAKEKVLKYAKAYKLTQLDVKLTKEVLKKDYEDLRNYMKEV